MTIIKCMRDQTDEISKQQVTSDYTKKKETNNIPPETPTTISLNTLFLIFENVQLFIYNPPPDPINEICSNVPLSTSTVSALPMYKTPPTVVPILLPVIADPVPLPPNTLS
jgi:hypothetical protein